MKKVIITEVQEKVLMQLLVNEDLERMPVPKHVNKPYCIDPDKVKIVKKFLDGNFTQGNIETIGSDGMPEKIRIVKMLSSDGNELKRLYEEDLLDLLIERYKKMFIDTEERRLFLSQVMKDWFNNKIGVHGTLSVNALK